MEKVKVPNCPPNVCEDSYNLLRIEENVLEALIDVTKKVKYPDIKKVKYCCLLPK